MGINNEQETVLDAGFSLFNCHINDAKDRAKDAFIKIHGSTAFENEIQPFLDKGIMSIFESKPNRWIRTYVDLIQAFVNEDHVMSVEQDQMANNFYLRHKDVIEDSNL